MNKAVLWYTIYFVIHKIVIQFCDVKSLNFKLSVFHIDMCWNEISWAIGNLLENMDFHKHTHTHTHTLFDVFLFKLLDTLSCPNHRTTIRSQSSSFHIKENQPRWKFEINFLDFFRSSNLFPFRYYICVKVNWDVTVRLYERSKFSRSY